MAWFVIVIPLFFSIAVQFSLWLNLLFPYNFLFENFNRNLYFALSLSGLLGACISIVFFKILSLEGMNKILIISAIAFHIFCILSCLLFFLSSLTGWLVI